MTSPHKTSIQAILFDYGRVLSAPPDPAAWSDMRRLTGLPEESLQSAYWALRHTYDQGHLTGRAYWQQVTTACIPKLSEEDLDQLLEADTRLWTQLNTPMVAWAQHLQRAGFKTGVLSNLGDAMAAGILARFDWLAAFDHCTWSYMLKMAKPDPAIFLHAADGLKTPPSAILFIDDLPDNVAAARKIGMVAIEYSNHQDFLNQMRNLGLADLLSG